MLIDSNLFQHFEKFNNIPSKSLIFRSKKSWISQFHSKTKNKLARKHRYSSKSYQNNTIKYAKNKTKIIRRRKKSSIIGIGSISTSLNKLVFRKQTTISIIKLGKSLKRD